MVPRVQFSSRKPLTVIFARGDEQPIIMLAVDRFEAWRIAMEILDRQAFLDAGDLLTVRRASDKDITFRGEGAT